MIRRTFTSGSLATSLWRERWRAGNLCSGVWPLALVMLTLLTPMRSACAIDPHRTLTQVLIRKWQIPQGLPQPRVLSLYQSRDGHLWIGTQSGLFQFDGLRFTPPACLHDRTALENVWVQQLAEDADGDLWIATIGDGLMRMHNGECQRFGIRDGLPSLNIQCMLFDRQGTLWIGTDHGLARRTADQITRAEPQQELTVQNVLALCETDQGTIWIGGDQGQLNLYRDGQYLTRRLSTVPADCVIRALLSTPEGSLLVGTTSGLVRLDEQGERVIKRADGLADDSIEVLTLSSTGQVWVGTRDGLSRMSDQEIETLRSRDGLSQSTVGAICEDAEKSLWVGTKNGLNQLVDRRTIPLTTSEGMPSNETGPLLQDAKGKIWIGTLDAGLAQYLGRRCELQANQQDGLPTDQVLSLCAGEPDELWIGTGQGLCRMRNSEVETVLTTLDGLPSDVILSLHRQPDDTLWIGTARGLATLRNEKLEAFAPESELARWPVRVIVPDDTGELVLATDGGGLFRVRPGELPRPWLSSSAEVRSVTALLPGPENSLWAATRGSGLLWLHDDQVTRFTVQQGLYDDEISGLVADDAGRIWMACSRGIFFVSQQELIEVARGEANRVSSTQFSPMEALRTIECRQGVQPSVCKMRDGKIWFSTMHGIIMIDPTAIYRKLPPPPVCLEEMQVNGQIVDPQHQLSLPAGRTNLMFRYSALSYAYPLRIQFRYMLEGFDKDWVDAGSRREAYYTNVPPGRYRFLVSAANPQNPWAALPRPVEFSVRTAFYRTFWFYGLMCTLLALCVWGTLRLRVLQVKTRMNAVLAERIRIARDLHDTLIQGFSGVTMQMQALASRLKSAPEREILQEVISDAGRCLREARQTVTGLRHDSHGATNLAEALARTARQLTETQNLQLQLDVPQTAAPLPPDTEYNLLRIAQEAITNVVKHADANSVAVSLLQTPSQLQLNIADDGRGFSMEDQQPAGHYGLIGMKERALQIQAQLRIDSRPGRGTTILLTLPHATLLPAISTLPGELSPAETSV